MSTPTNRKFWRFAVIFFVIAGCTGVLFRAGMLGIDLFGLSLQNVRHAHSHLMFFGWAGLIPFLVANNNLNNGFAHTSNRLQSLALWAIVILSPITFVFFLLWGYHPVAIGSANLPLAAIASSFVMIAWYLFAIGYWRSKKESTNGYHSWFSVALFMLIVSSLGAWGVGALQFVEVQNVLLPKALTHFFLGTFTEGWVVLVIIGIIVHALDLKPEAFLISQGTIRTLIAIGAPLSFAYGLPSSMLNTELLWSARVGGLMSSFGLLAFIYTAFKSDALSNSIWKWPIILLAIKALFQLIISVFPNEIWLSDHNLRVLYLHILLLGAFTLTGFGWICQRYQINHKIYLGMVISCLAVLVSLILPTNLIPVTMKGIWIFQTMTAVAALPVISAIWYLILMWKSARN
jgi:hypothetical protein